jgi:hypothetical protein
MIRRKKDKKKRLGEKRRRGTERGKKEVVEE